MIDLDILNFNGSSIYYFYDNRDPNSGDDSFVNSIPFPTQSIILSWNTSTQDIWQLTNFGSSPLLWIKLANNDNILNIINTNGWNLNTSRSYSLRSSPAFSTSYQPSITNDTMVTAVLSLTSTLLTAGTVQFQIDTGSGFSTIGEVSISGLAATNIQTMTCLTPKSSHYKLVNSSGTSSIISVNEIQL